MLTGVMVDVVGTTAQMEQEEQSLKMLKRDIADVVPWISFQLVKPPFFFRIYMHVGVVVLIVLEARECPISGPVG